MAAARALRVPAGYLFLVSLLAVSLPRLVIAASCGVSLPGSSTSPVPQWPVLTTSASNPFVGYVTNDVTAGNGDVVTIFCTDVTCTAAPIVTSHIGQVNGYIANAGLFPNIAVGATTALPTFGYARPDDKFIWDTCQSANCTQTTRWLVSPNGQITGMTLVGSPLSAAGVPVAAYSYFLNTTSNGEIGTLKCSTTDCKNFSNYKVVDNDVNAAWGNPSQLSSLIAFDQLLLLAYIKFGSLTVAKCVDQACIGAQTPTTLPIGASKNCRIAMRLSGLNLPLIAFCDSNNDLRVAACNNDACTSAAISPVLVAGVGKGPLSTAGQYGGVQLSMAVQSCQSNLPLIAYTTYDTGALGVLKCNDGACTSGTATTVIGSNVVFADMIAFDSAHPLAGILMLVYSRFTGASFVLERMYCLDGLCTECGVSAPQPTTPANYLNPCGVLVSTPPVYPPAPPQTTQPVLTGPSGPCSVLTNCGPVPTTDWPLICCDGTWVVDANATAAQPTRAIQVLSNVSIYWNGDLDIKENDTFTIYIDPSRFARKRQSQEALIKVNGDASIGGPLDIVLNTPPTQSVAQAALPIISTVSQTGQISGEFTSVNVTLNYEGASCSDASATQSKSVDGSALSVLVSVTNRCKGHKGLTTGQKVAIGVTVGVVGAALIIVIVVVLVLRFSPRTARKMGLTKRSQSMQLGRRDMARRGE